MGAAVIALGGLCAQVREASVCSNGAGCFYRSGNEAPLALLASARGLWPCARPSPVVRRLLPVLLIRRQTLRPGETFAVIRQPSGLERIDECPGLSGHGQAPQITGHRHAMN